jgi:FkbM family methyltransferase
MIRLTRATRFLPWFPLMSLLQGVWGRVLDPGKLYRISDFDGNLKLDVNMAEAIGAALWHVPDLYERRERKLFCSAITPGCAVLDVGANIGIYTLLAAKRGARVFAVEADPANAAKLRHHLDMNDLGQQVTVFEMAAIDREGTVLLHRNPSNSGGSSLTVGVGTVQVRGLTIDSLNLPPIDLCKMDIEGAELGALIGMRDILRRSAGMKLLIEYNCLSDRAALLDFLRSTFMHIAVAGRDELNGIAPPPDCNLWCWT